MKNILNKKIIVALCTAVCAVTACVCGCAPQHEHKMTPHSVVPSTCTEHGSAAYYECTDCKKLFTDENGEHETTKAALELPYADHIYGEMQKIGSYHWCVCEECEEKFQEDHVFTTVTDKAVTATEDGYKAGEICLDCGYGKNGGQVIPKTTPFVSTEKFGVNYCLYEPKNVGKRGEKVPLILFLSGSGERGDDNVAQLKNAICKVVKHGEDNEYMNSVVVVPQCPAEPAQWVDTPWTDVNYTLASVKESDIMKKVVELVGYYRELDYIDENRIYVIGVSMGGFGAWDLLARHSDMFAAGVPICGGGPSDAIDVLKEMPIYTFHGNMDKNVPFEGTKNMVDAIKAAGGTKINFKEYNNAHVIWDDAIVHEGLEEWLFAQSK